MSPANRPLRILVAEDNEEDFLLMREAMTEAGVACELRWVRHGEAVMEDLHASLDAVPSHPAPPDLIVLDLEMPRMRGTEVLEALRGDEALKAIPVVVLSNSSAGRDVAESYRLGAHSYIQKPADFDEFVEAVGTVGRYWSNVVYQQRIALGNRPTAAGAEDN